jgi:hypothetical protein
MKKLFLVPGIFLIAAALLSQGTPALAISRGQQRLLAKRAAQVDAYRNLAEQIKGLRISGNTYVRDFVAESDEIATSFDTFIKGAKFVGQPVYYEDGTCEVTVEVTLQQVIQELRRIQKTYHYVRSSVTYNFNQMATVVKKKVIRATGSGAPREY